MRNLTFPFDIDKNFQVIEYRSTILSILQFPRRSPPKKEEKKYFFQTDELAIFRSRNHSTFF